MDSEAVYSAWESLYTPLEIRAKTGANSNTDWFAPSLGFSFNSTRNWGVCTKIIALLIYFDGVTGVNNLPLSMSITRCLNYSKLTPTWCIYDDEPSEWNWIILTSWLNFSGSISLLMNFWPFQSVWWVDYLRFTFHSYQPPRPFISTPGHASAPLNLYKLIIHINPIWMQLRIRLMISVDSTVTQYNIRLTIYFYWR